MSPRSRGLITLVGFIIFAVIFCGIIPFVVMPNGGTGVALPVIEVPGEVVVEDWLPGFNLTNSIIGTLTANVLVLLIVFVLWRMSRGWTREIPSRLQGMFEVFIDGFRGFCRGIAGEKLMSTPLLWPLVATIFFFLLTANYMKLLPGVETVGKMHCAYAGQSGFAMLPGSGTVFGDSYRLWVDTPLDPGNPQTAEEEVLCNDYFKKHYIPKDGFPVETVEEIQARDAAFVFLIDQLPSDSDLEAQAREELLAEDPELEGDELADEVADRLEELKEAREEAYAELLLEQEEVSEGELEAAAENAAGRLELVAGSTYEDAYNYHRYAEYRVERSTVLADASSQIEALEAEIATLEGDHSEEADEEEAASGHLVMAGDVPAFAVEEDAEEHSDEDLINEQIDALEEELDGVQDVFDEANTQIRYPFATLTFTEDQIETGAKPYIFHITPFVRGPATDLSFTFALAFLSILIVQIYGVMALGPAYFEKFINLTALGNVGKRPLGVIDFVVGVIEIISEVAKIVSLAFRLFGNLFAGGVALMAVTFLVALVVPGVIYGLELIIGAVQALVFAVLTLVFSVQAMESHHHDDEHDDHGHEAAH